MINAFHSNWTEPYMIRNKNGEYKLEDFEILTTILSALKWREFNGPIKMVTDERGAEYYKKIGLESLWDLGIDVSLNKINADIDPNIFWAAGKIFALKQQKTPICTIDTDFIIWDNVKELLQESEIAAIHKEKIQENIYPHKEYFNIKKSYSFDESWDWDIEPFNTAFAYINHLKFKEYYATAAIEFMKAIDFSDNKITNMVFAEQRMISMCAKKLQIEIKEICNLQDLYSGTQNMFTHIWGYKDFMRKDKQCRAEFCKKCIIRIIRDYPDYEKHIADIEALKEYYSEIKKSRLTIV